MIRFRVPANLLLTGPTPESLDLQGSFEEEGSRVTYALTGQAAFPLPDLGGDRRGPQFARFSEAIEFEVIDREDGKLRRLLAGQDWRQLSQVMGKIANRVLRSVRNFGYVPAIAEMALRPDEAQRNLRSWRVSALQDDGQYRALVEPPDSIVEMLVRGMVAAGQGELDVARWPAIEEAIRHDLEPGPHQEFVTNSLGHLRVHNYRYALLEAIIGLEIVLTNYLRLFLERRGISKGRIDAFLGPQLGLRDRVAVLLKLAAEEGALRGVNVDDVLTAIAWRNKLIHEEGKLPVIDEATLRARILSVILLVGIVAEMLEGLRAAPELQAASEQLSREFAHSFSRMGPFFKAYLGGGITARYIYVGEQAVPTREQMETIAARTGDVLAQQIPRFDRARHLVVRFILFPEETIARWSGGALTILRQS